MPAVLMTPQKPKITLSFDDLHAPQVEERLRQQSALSTAVENSQRAAVTPSRLPIPDGNDTSVWRNAFVNLAIFGLIGGLLAWGCGELVQHFNPNLRDAAQELEQSIHDLRQVQKAGRVKSAARIDEDVALVKQMGAENPWFQVDIDTSLTEAQKESRRGDLRQRDAVRNGFADVCFYAACGVMIAIALGMAESVAGHNAQQAVVYGGVGALLGLLGGVTFALVANPLYHALGGGQSIEKASLAVQVFARAVGWGLLGLFLSAAPGIVLRNARKLGLGLLGGVVGGFVGGALFDPMVHLTGNPTLSRLIAIVSIGVISGLGTALVENAIKQGWLKVTQGLIAGKQFIVYRNPTFIGSSPQCEVYLFKDFKVGPRHAALHITASGYDVEDLGTGSGTTVNGRSVRRARLRNGDRVQIGATAFEFHERERKG